MSIVSNTACLPKASFAARVVSNAHIIAPSNKDFNVPAPSGRSTFPEPLPHFLLPNNSIPPAIPAVRKPTSANAGRFSLSLKGMRRQLWSSGPRTELLMKDVEDEIVGWLAAGGVMLAPDVSATLDSPGAPIDRRHPRGLADPSSAGVEHRGQRVHAVHRALLCVVPRCRQLQCIVPN